MTEDGRIHVQRFQQQVALQLLAVKVPQGIDIHV